MLGVENFFGDSKTCPALDTKCLKDPHKCQKYKQFNCGYLAALEATGLKDAFKLFCPKCAYICMNKPSLCLSCLYEMNCTQWETHNISK